MIATFSVIGFLVLILIYFVMRSQNLQREISRFRHSLKSTDSQAKYALTTLAAVSNELQKTFVSRLEAHHKRGLISGDDYRIANFILNHAGYVVMQCCEHKCTVEEAVNKALENDELSITDINQYIAKQASEIRVPWCKNSITSFVTACNNISVGQVKAESASTSAAEA